MVPQNGTQVNPHHKRGAPTYGNTIEVIACRPGTGRLKATLSIRCGAVIINGVRVHSDKRGTFVDMPARLVDGEWQPDVEITVPAVLDAVRQVAIAAAATVGVMP